jgi:hypothetical protein
MSRLGRVSSPSGRSRSDRVMRCGGSFATKGGAGLGITGSLSVRLGWAMSTLGPGIDGTMINAFALYDAGAQPNALCALAAEIPPRHREKRLATVVLAGRTDIPRASHFGRLLAPVRPNWKESLRITRTVRDWRRGPECVSRSQASTSFRRAWRPCTSTRTTIAANIGNRTCDWCIGRRRSRPDTRHQIRAGRPILSASSCCGRWWDYPAARLSTASARVWSRLTGNG